mgnify:CR=1 FL=1|jgi:hypothetical protein
MWSRTPTALFWPWLLSWSLACSATATAWRLSAMLAPPTRPAWRTPLLRLHVSTLSPSPRAGLSRPSAWLRPPLHLVRPD